jgi:hypothetical protein
MRLSQKNFKMILCIFMEGMNKNGSLVASCSVVERWVCRWMDYKKVQKET